jgi:toxin ParE1/3/4
VNCRFTVAAQRDLAGIWWYIARDNENAADRFVESLKERCERLGQNPRSGVSRDAISRGLRNIVYGEYLIFYRVARPGVRIVRVLHGRRNLSPLLH